MALASCMLEEIQKNISLVLWGWTNIHVISLLSVLHEKREYHKRLEKSQQNKCSSDLTRPQLHITLQPCNSVARIKYCNALFSAVRNVERAPEMTLPGGAGWIFMIVHANTDTPWIIQQFHSARSHTSWILHKSELSVHKSQLYMYVQGSPVEIQTPTHRTWLVAVCPPLHLCCHLASTTIISFCFHSHKEKLGTHYKNFISCFFFSNISLKLHNLPLHKSGIVCSHNNRYWIWGSYAQHSVTSWCKFWDLLNPSCEECYWPSGICRNIWLLKICKGLRWVSKPHSTELLYAHYHCIWLSRKGSSWTQ